MESDDKTAKETTLGRLIKPLLGSTMYTTSRPFFSHLPHVNQADPVSQQPKHTHASTNIKIRQLRSGSASADLIEG